jgi:hypothetical protein
MTKIAAQRERCHGDSHRVRLSQSHITAMTIRGLRRARPPGMAVLAPPIFGKSRRLFEFEDCDKPWQPGRGRRAKVPAIPVCAVVLRRGVVPDVPAGPVLRRFGTVSATSSCEPARGSDTTVECRPSSGRRSAFLGQG